MSFVVKNLTCNHMKNPVGVDDVPYFSFQLDSSDSEEKLISYKISVRTEKDTVWDSCLVNKDKQILIKYAGPELLPETRYFWCVIVHNSKGEKTVSEEAFFETGRLKPFAWEAKWITSDDRYVNIASHSSTNIVSTAPYMRKEFSVNKDIKEATLYICGLGLYECFINGKSVKDTYLDPHFTQYDKAVCYNTYKIENLKKGMNAIGIVLGDGYYNSNTKDSWSFMHAAWRDHSKCICVLKIDYSDGTVERIVSDETFKGINGPITENDMRTVECYDARLELGNWKYSGYDDSKWENVKITKQPGGELVGQYTTPIKITDKYKPVLLKKLSENVFLYDVGFNTCGWAEISFSAPAGTEIKIRYAELFEDDYKHMKFHYKMFGNEDFEKFQTEVYIAKGIGTEKWHPHFKYNGFRYFTVTCDTGIPEDFSVEVHEVRTDLNQIGKFNCSNDMLNKFQELALRSAKTNFHGIPTDCPHREKNGWTADAQISSEQVLYNFDVAAAYTTWLYDMIRAQRPSGQLPGIVPTTGWGYNWGSGPAWDATCAIIPYNMYLYCGDTRILEIMYPTIKKYIEFCDSMAIDNICEFGLPDWCPPERNSHVQCDTAVTDTAYYYQVNLIAAKIAKILGYSDYDFYHNRAMKIRDSFRKHFIDSSGDTVILKCTECQTAIGCILYFGFAEENEIPELLSRLENDIKRRDYHFDFGLLGAKFVSHVLVDYGMSETFIKAATNPTYPSFAYIVLNGATTFWENWEPDIIDSKNHHMYSDIVSCLYQGITGIYPDEKNPGFKNTVFRPQFIDDMDFAETEHISPYGKLSASWKKDKDTVIYTVTVPTNCTADFLVPDGWKIISDNKNLKLNSGKYNYVLIKN